MYLEFPDRVLNDFDDWGSAHSNGTSK